MIKIFKIFEIVWLLIAIMGAVMSVYKISTEGIDEAYMFIAMMVAGGISYVLRRRRRISYEKEG